MTARKGGLGRGLAALITNQPDSRLGDNAADIVIGGARKPEPDDEETPTSAALRPQLEVVPETELAAHYQEIPTDLIDPNPKNPRKVFDNFDLDELVHSIKEFGLLQPIVVRRSGDRYELVMGERRWRAATQAGLDTIPAIVRKTDDDSMLRDALLENVHRVQLNPLEEAAAYEQLLEEFGVTQSELADKLGRSRPVVTNMLRLLKLPVAVQQKVAAGVLSAGHARALLAINEDQEGQERLANRIVSEGLSVRATEEAVVLLSHGETGPVRKRAKAPMPEYLTTAAESLADNLDTKVSVSMGKHKGRIVVEFGGKDDFERIMGLLSGDESAGLAADLAETAGITDAVLPPADAPDPADSTE